LLELTRPFTRHTELRGQLYQPHRILSQETLPEYLGVAPPEAGSKQLQLGVEKPVELRLLDPSVRPRRREVAQQIAEGSRVGAL
jgi:hypothetical protein